MEIDKLVKIVDHYASLIKTAHNLRLAATKQPCQLPQDLVPRRTNTDCLAHEMAVEDISAHLLYMCEQIKMIAQTKPAKAMRWICFLQGCMWTGCLASIDDFRDDNVTILEEPDFGK